MNISILRFLHGHVAHSSYLLSDPLTGTAVVVDPYRSVDPYLEAANWMSAKIRHIFLTQQHDDFQSGHRELRERTGATLYAGAWTRPPFDFLPVKDGDALEFGQVRLKILETPGHRLEAISLLVFDLLGSESQAIAAFTGDTLVLGDVGVPEPGPEDALTRTELAGMLHESLRRKILTLPPSTRIYPAHADLNPGERDALFGKETLLRTQRTWNPALRAMTAREFEIRILAGTKRDEFVPQAGDEVRLRPVSVTELLRGRRAGAQIVDVRSPADFAAAHLEKSLNIPLMAAFEPWVGAILDPDEPAILIAPPGQEREAAARLQASGFAHIGGYLKDGMQAFEDRSQLLQGDRRYCLPSLEEALQQVQPPQLLEIGPPDAFGAGLKIPLQELRKEMKQLSRTQEIAVCSETPFRTSAAASFLRSCGFPRVRTLAGGLALWGRRPLDRIAAEKR